MRSLRVAFPDAVHLLSLDPDQLAGLLLFPFRAIPWRTAPAARRCVLRWVAPYPEHLRADLTDALMNVWIRLESEGLLDRPGHHYSDVELVPVPRSIHLRA